MNRQTLLDWLGKLEPIANNTSENPREDAHAVVAQINSLLKEPSQSPISDVTEAVTKTVIEVEKMLCEKLGKQWRPSGMSVQTLTDELASSQAPQAPAVPPGYEFAKGLHDNLWDLCDGESAPMQEPPSTPTLDCAELARVVYTQMQRECVGRSKWEELDGYEQQRFVAAVEVCVALQPASETPPQPPTQSPTFGMSIAERILHVGGRNNAAGYVEFGSIQAVQALVRQYLRDMKLTGDPQ